jgi:ribose-phosphate pyrophosphokinase
VSAACDPRPTLHAFPDSVILARSVGDALGLPVSPVECHRFPDGESLVRTRHDGSGQALLFRSLDRPNEKLIEILLAADALRRQGASWIGLVAPYLAYMRQDRVFHDGEPVSQRVVAGLLDDAFDAVRTVEAHLHRIERLSEIFRNDARSLSACEPIAEWLAGQKEGFVLIGPDAESEPWIRSIAEVGGHPWSVGRKTRRADRDVTIELDALPEGVTSAWIVDDIASSGATLEAIVRVLRARDLRWIGAIVVHALIGDGARERLDAAGLDRLVSTDSIVDATNAIALGPLLAREIATLPATSETS